MLSDAVICPLAGPGSAPSPYNSTALGSCEAGDDGGVVTEEAVAVQLDELVGHGLDELECVWPPQVTGLLDASPDLGDRVRLGLG